LLHNFWCDISNYDVSKLMLTQNKKQLTNRLPAAVQKPREQIADAEALLDIATSLGASVRSQSALGITPSDLVAGLLKKFGTRADANGEGASLRWGRVGLAASHVFMAVPGCSTM
jgi:hypothetical protein